MAARVQDSTHIFQKWPGAFSTRADVLLYRGGSALPAAASTTTTTAAAAAAAAAAAVPPSSPAGLGHLPHHHPAQDPSAAVRRAVEELLPLP